MGYAPKLHNIPLKPTQIIPFTGKSSEYRKKGFKTYLSTIKRQIKSLLK